MAICLKAKVKSHSTSRNFKGKEHTHACALKLHKHNAGDSSSAAKETGTGGWFYALICPSDRYTPEQFPEFHKELFIIPLYYSSTTKVLVIRSFLFQPYIFLRHSGYLSVSEGGCYMLLDTERTFGAPFSPYEIQTPELTNLSTSSKRTSSFHLSTEAAVSLSDL